MGEGVVKFTESDHIDMQLYPKKIYFSLESKWKWQRRTSISNEILRTCDEVVSSDNNRTHLPLLNVEVGLKRGKGFKSDLQI